MFKLFITGKNAFMKVKSLFIKTVHKKALKKA